jgi:hypothetical protein
MMSRIAVGTRAVVLKGNHPVMYFSKSLTIFALSQFHINQENRRTKERFDAVLAVIEGNVYDQRTQSPQSHHFVFLLF